MLNDDRNCDGEYTWSRGGQKSVIDYALVNGKAYRKFHNMKIDEGKEKYDLSNHSLLEIEFKINEELKEYKKQDWIMREYYKTDRISLDKFRGKLEEKIIRNSTQKMEEGDWRARKNIQ